MSHITALLLGHIGALNAGDDAIALSTVGFYSRNPIEIRKIYVQSHGSYMDQQLLAFSGNLLVSPISTLFQILLAFLKSHVAIS